MASSDIGVEAATGSVSVGGRFKPGNDVRKMFMIRGAIVFELVVKYRLQIPMRGLWVIVETKDDNGQSISQSVKEVWHKWLRLRLRLLFV